MRVAVDGSGREVCSL